MRKETRKAMAVYSKIHARFLKQKAKRNFAFNRFFKIFIADKSASNHLDFTGEQ